MKQFLSSYSGELLQKSLLFAPNVKGVAWATAAVGLFAFIYLSGKLTGGEASALQIIWLRYAGGFITVSIWLLISREKANHLKTPQPLIHAARALAGGSGGIAAIYAATNMRVADASAIGLLDGLFTIIFGIVFLKEFVPMRQWLAAILCLAGAGIVVSGKGAFQGDGTLLWIPAFIALCGAIFVAVESILIKTLARSESLITVLFYVNLFGTIIFAGPGLWEWQPTSPILVFLFLLLGPLAILAQACNIFAFRLSDAALLGPVRYSWILFGILFGVLFFSEKPDLTTYVGAALVLIGGVWLAKQRSNSAPMPKK